MKKALTLYKKEIIMTAALLLAAVFSLVLMNVLKEDGAFAEVTMGGEVIAVYPLSEDGRYTLNEVGNVIVIEDGAVYMESADCPDKTCVLRGKIRYSGESIVCLPNKLSIVIRGADSGPDLVS